MSLPFITDLSGLITLIPAAIDGDDFQGDFRRTLTTPFPPLNLVTVWSIAPYLLSGKSQVATSILVGQRTVSVVPVSRTLLLSPFHISAAQTSHRPLCTPRSSLFLSDLSRRLLLTLTAFHISGERKTRLNNCSVKDYSEMFPLWDDEVEDTKSDNIVKAIFSGGWVWDQTHWPVVGTRLWTSVKVEYKKVKTSKRERCSSPTESEEESPRKKARLSPGLKAEIEVWLTGITSNMVEGLARCEKLLETQGRMLQSLAKKMGDLEKIVRGGGKEDCTNAGSSDDIPEDDNGDIPEDDKEDKDEDDPKSEESKAKESIAEESRAEESRAEEATPKKGRPKRGQAKKGSPKAVEASPKRSRPERGQAPKATVRVERIYGINAGDDESASNGAVDIIESNKTESIPNFRASLMKVVVERWRSGGRVMVSYGGDGRVKSQGGGVVTARL
ncbi:hypothetical protein Bca52824_026767 [Brassica carinata]|uniref:Uncharacterized protein n=1 Tax=Brassica carinata TaxID=52824 RepID=A0A8X7V944_BRACI|nr:hypothetical protein Bca52824_026767 [Brassica carinata]